MKTIMKETIVPFSKTKLILLFLGSIGIVALGLWLIQIADTQTRYDPTYLKVLSAAMIVFSGLCTIYYFTKFFDKKPGLVINDEGIIDNASAVCAGLIKWENITGVSINEIYGQKFLAIYINNVDEIISKQRGFKKAVMSLNKNYFNSPIQISSNGLKCNFEDLYNLIEERLSAGQLAKTELSWAWGIN